MMPIHGDDLKAIEALLYLCHEGKFYEDYDESWFVLREAQEAFNRINEGHSNG